MKCIWGTWCRGFLVESFVRVAVCKLQALPGMNVRVIGASGGYIEVVRRAGKPGAAVAGRKILPTNAKFLNPIICDA